MSLAAFLYFTTFITFLQLNQGVERLKEFPIPVGTGVLSVLNRKNNFEVYVHDKRVFVKSEKYSRERGAVPPFKITHRRMDFNPETLKLKVDDGWIIAFNMGEWGGRVYWYDKSGKIRYPIENLSNVLEFLRIDNKIYAVSGLAHMGTNHGAISEITHRTGKWLKVDYLDLPEAPMAVTVLTDKSILIITVSKLIRVYPDKQIELLIENGFWSVYLHPKSLAVYGNTIYAGMAGGVMKTTFRNPSKQVWMTE